MRWGGEPDIDQLLAERHPERVDDAIRAQFGASSNSHAAA